MTVDRLSALDECFLRTASAATHPQVGWTLLVQGEAPGADELRALLTDRLELLPRFRRRVSSSWMHGSSWVDDRSFELGNHVAYATLPYPGGPAELRELCGRLLSVPLHHDRPLWRIHVVDGLHSERFAIVAQLHQALVGGLGVVELAQLLLDRGPRTTFVTPAGRRPWSPAPEPGPIGRLLATGADRARLGRSAGSLALRALATPVRWQDALAGMRGLGSALGAIGSPAPCTTLNRPIGPERSVAFAGLPRHSAHELARLVDGAVNDVVLATTALALGRYLRREGECHPWLRVCVPDYGRHARDGAELGTRPSMMFVELPVGERDPRAVLAEVCRQTRGRKRDEHAAAVDGTLRAAALAPAPVRDGIAWLLTRPQTFNAVVADISGPAEPLYLLGRRAQAAYPLLPLLRSHCLSIGVLSYGGELEIGLCGYPPAVPNLVAIARDFSSSFEALRSALGVPSPRRPARPRKLRAAERPVLV